jgi:hypothetical protein
MLLVLGEDEDGNHFAYGIALADVAAEGEHGVEAAEGE